MNFGKIASFALGPLGAALFGFITLPMVTWFYPPEDVGRLAMLQVAINFTALLFGLGLDQAYIREYHTSDSQPALFKAAVLPGLVVLLLALAPFLLRPTLLSDLLFEIESWTISAMVAFCVLAAFAVRFLSLILRMEERGVAFSMGQVLPKLFFLLIVALFALWGIRTDTWHLLFAHAFALILVACGYTWALRRVWWAALHESVDRDKQRQMIAYGFPLIFAGLAFWGLTATDRILLRSLSTFEELGKYSVAANIAAAALVLKTLFQTLWAPQVYKWESEGSSAKKIRAMNHYMLVCIVILFSLVGALSWMIDLLLPVQYESVKYLLVPCLAYPMLFTLSETTAVGINLARKTGYSVAVAGAAFLANAGLNLILIPRFAAAGAAVATVLAFWLFFLLRSEFSARVWESFPRREQYCFTTIIVVLAALTPLLGDTIGVGVHWLWALLLAFFLIYYAGTVMDGVRLIRKKWVGRNNDK